MKLEYCNIIFSLDPTNGIGWLLSFDSINHSSNVPVVTRSKVLKDSDGKVGKVAEMVECLNFLGQQGWEVCQSFRSTISDRPSINFLLKRESE